MNDIQVWTDILDITSSDHSVLAELLGRQEERQTAILPQKLELGLRYKFSPILKELLDLGMASRSAETCHEVFCAHTRALAADFEAHHTRSWQTLAGSDDEEAVQLAQQALRTLYTTKFLEGLYQLKTRVLDWAKAQIAASSHRLSTDSSPSEAKTWDSKTNPRAKELLEEVFQKNQTPNAAEKREMASATGLTTKQITTWFSNRRQRSKGHKPHDLEATPRRRTVTARKASSSSIDSMPSLSSSVSSSSSHHSWDGDASPIRQEPPAEVDFAAFLRSVSPTPIPKDQPMQDSECPAYFNYPSIEMVQLESPSSQPDTIMQNWEAPLQLEIPSLANYLADTAPPLNLDTSAGTGPEFWEEIYQITRGAAGQQPLEQDDPFANITITPEADDWSTVFAGFDWVPATPGQCSLPY